MPVDLYNMVCAVPFGSDLFHHAIVVCHMRGIEAHVVQTDMGNPMGLANWQRVVAEFFVFHQALPPR